MNCAIEYIEENKGQYKRLLGRKAHSINIGNKGTESFLNKDNSVIAHEIGHAYDYSHPKSILLANMNDNLLDRKFIKDYGIKDPSNLYGFKVDRHTRMLLEEAAASVNGIRLMKKLGASPEELIHARKQAISALKARKRLLNPVRHLTTSKVSEKEAIELANQTKDLINNTFNDSVKKILTVGRGGKERLFEREQLNPLEKLKRSIKYNKIKASRQLNK